MTPSVQPRVPDGNPWEDWDDDDYRAYEAWQNEEAERTYAILAARIEAGETFAVNPDAPF